MRGTGDDRGDTAPTDQGHHYGLAQRLTGGKLPLAAAPARPEMRERETAAPAGTTRERITRLTARLDELGRPAEEVRITRKTLLELPDPQPPATPPPKPPAIRPTRRSWRCAPLRAWQVCEAMDMEIAPKNINNTRVKLKRLTERGILVETEQGLSPATPNCAAGARSPAPAGS